MIKVRVRNLFSTFASREGYAHQSDLESEAF